MSQRLSKSVNIQNPVKPTNKIVFFQNNHNSIGRFITFSFKNSSHNFRYQKYSWCCRVSITYLLHGAGSFFRSQPVLSSSKKCQHFMESEGSLLRLQQPVTCPSPEPQQSSQCPLSHFLKIHLNIILPSTPGSSKWSLSFRFPHQKPFCVEEC